MNVYRERAQLVAFLAGLYPAMMGTDEKEPDYPVVYVTTPEGQLSWHIAREDMDLFAHIPEGGVAWDEHTTEEKYERLQRLITENYRTMLGRP